MNKNNNENTVKINTGKNIYSGISDNFVKLESNTVSKDEFKKNNDRITTRLGTINKNTVNAIRQGINTNTKLDIISTDVEDIKNFSYKSLEKTGKDIYDIKSFTHKISTNTNDTYNKYLDLDKKIDKAKKNIRCFLLGLGILECIDLITHIVNYFS